MQGESAAALVLLILLSFLASSFRMDTYPLDTVCEGEKHTVFLSGLAVVQSMALPKLIKPPSISLTKPCRSSNPTH